MIHSASRRSFNARLKVIVLARALRLVIASIAMLASAGKISNAQVQRDWRAKPVRPEARLDVLSGDATAVHIGAGGVKAMNPYLRLGALAGAGSARVEDAWRPSGRVELLARVVLDPLAERTWGVYAVAGMGVRWDAGRSGNPAIVIAVGVEGPTLAGVRPAIEAGVGGGARVAVRVSPARSVR